MNVVIKKMVIYFIYKIKDYVVRKLNIIVKINKLIKNI